LQTVSSSIFRICGVSRGPCACAELLLVEMILCIVEYYDAVVAVPHSSPLDGRSYLVESVPIIARCTAVLRLAAAASAQFRLHLFTNCVAGCTVRPRRATKYAQTE